MSATLSEQEGYLSLLQVKPMQMSPEQVTAAIEALQSRGATLPCPRCGNAAFTVFDLIFNQQVAEGLTPISGAPAGFRGPTIPSVVAACTNCGFLSQHALGLLGLMPSEVEKPDLSVPDSIENRSEKTNAPIFTLGSGENSGNPPR